MMSILESMNKTLGDRAHQAKRTGRNSAAARLRVTITRSREVPVPPAATVAGPVLSFQRVSSLLSERAEPSSRLVYLFVVVS